ncbi:hypothetical protein [Desulforamulus aquiferis]|uniref:Uncharacterized protein n=1 Tax=Desulforamulus aquiferis TaxID=1397668 RepID=A0AAW7ZC26_9FIRM|nr:hypothetical protein [Desulforamulus aquiferis]MDO7787234.1 hypothetical protein [Desulforamulus aquiferis]
MTFEVDMWAILYGFFFTMKLVWPFIAVFVLAILLLAAIKRAVKR